MKAVKEEYLPSDDDNKQILDHRNDMKNINITSQIHKDKDDERELVFSCSQDLEIKKRINKKDVCIYIGIALLIIYSISVTSIFFYQIKTDSYISKRQNGCMQTENAKIQKKQISTSKDKTQNHFQIPFQKQTNSSSELQKFNQTKKQPKVIFQIKLQQAEPLTGIQKLQNLYQLPFCFLIGQQGKQAEQILLSIKEQEYSNYQFILLKKQVSLNEPRIYTRHKQLIKKKCGDKSIILYLKSAIKADAVNSLNQIHQRYNVWVTYTNLTSEQYQVVSFHYRIFQLLQQNDFQFDNTKFLQKGNLNIVAIGLLELSLMFSKRIEGQFGQISPLKIAMDNDILNSRTPYTKLFQLGQDYKIDLNVEQKFLKSLKRIKSNPEIELNRQKFRKAVERLQLLYLDKNHSIAILQKLESQQLFQNLTQNLKKIEETRFCVTVLSNNNIKKNLYKKVLISIFQQEYQNYHIVFLDDLSADENLQKSIQFTKIYGFPKERIVFIKNTQRKFATYNIINAAYNFCQQNQVQLLIDGDDQIIGRQAFSLLNKVYTKNKIQGTQKWIVYSNYKSNQNAIGNSRRFISMDMIFDKQKQIRKKKRLIGPIRTWRVELIRSIPLEYHQNQPGNWINNVYDDALQYSLLQLSGVERVQFLPEILYQYKRQFGSKIIDQNRKGLDIDKKIYRWILSLKPLKKLNTLQKLEKQKDIENIFNQDRNKVFFKIQI